MPVKKKTPMPKSAETRNVPGASPAQDRKNGQVGPPRETEPSQMQSFEEGMRLFHARQFQPARESFLRAMGGTDRAVAHRAGLHARICEQRLESAGPVLNTPEEHTSELQSLRHLVCRLLLGSEEHTPELQS